MTPNRKTSDRLLPKQRSAVTNGHRLFVQGDGNSPWTRRYKDLIHEHADDLGGADHLSQAQLSLIRRAATISVQLEAMEGLLSQGADADMDLFGRLSGHLRRIFESLGIDRRKKDITPDLGDYIEQVR